METVSGYRPGCGWKKRLLKVLKAVAELRAVIPG